VNTKERFYELDLLRFIAAFAVMLYHYTFRGYAADDMSVLSFAPLDVVTRYGFLGVELFFMISGFVILFTAQGSTARKFTASRVARLYPAFWACLSLTAIITVLFNDPRYSVSLTQYLANLSMVSSVFGVEDVDGVYWTLLVEIKFYLMIFLLLLLGLLHRIQIFLFIWLACSVASQFVSLPYSIEFFLMPGNSAYFISGATFFLIRREGFSVSKVVLLLSSYAYAIYLCSGDIKILSDHYQAEYSWAVTATIITVFYILFLFMTLKKLELLNQPRMLTLGVLTYPLYLLHQNIGYMIFNLSEGYVSKWLVLLGVIILMMWLSLMVHKHIEKRFGPSLKRWFEVSTVQRKTTPM